MLKTVWLDNLIKVMEYENKLYDRLLDMAENKTFVVVKGELESLQTITAKEQELSEELKKLDDIRDKITGQIENGLGKDSDNIVIADLIGLVPDEYSKRLSVISESLKETVNRIKMKNDLNRQLINNALEYVDFSLNLLTQPVPQTMQYGRKGDEADSKSHRVLDIKY